MQHIYIYTLYTSILDWIGFTWIKEGRITLFHLGKPRQEFQAMKSDLVSPRKLDVNHL